MTLNQALACIRQPRTGRKKVHFLVCGCQPLHLATLLEAHILERAPQDPVEILTGLYGDFFGNLEKAAVSEATAAVVVLEWSDLDPRLGLRSSGGWSATAKQDILATCRERYPRLLNAIQRLSASMPVVFAPPSLPITPIANTIRAQKSVLELEIEHQLSGFLLDLAQVPGVRVIRQPHDTIEALDAKMELLAGFPYTIPFTSALTGALAGVLYQPQPKKGLITDLDETLWAGIVGEVGPQGVSWDQEHHTQIHGLYQQMLGHLADCGVLLGACSKNEPSTVQTALARKDLLFSADSLFPICANWGAKSASIAEILRVWNIGADAVVFIDDNPMELSEVQQAFPAMTCLPFHGNRNPGKAWQLLGDLRDLFGKPLIMEEDRLRQASLRASAQLRDLGGDASSPEFLRGLEGTVTIAWNKDPADKRPLDLINKTNQFNLNGRRITEGEWQRCLEEPDTILAVVSYQDKFGPLGKIAVLAGTRHGACLKVSHWVMSCRAFSRRIEHQTLERLFRRFDVEDIQFAFQATERNQPLCEFFSSIGISEDTGSSRIARSQFLSQCGELPHQTAELTA